MAIPFLYKEAHTSQHVFVPCYNLFMANIGGLSAFIHNSAVGVHHSVRGHCGVGGGVLEAKFGSELAVDRAGEVDT